MGEPLFAAEGHPCDRWLELPRRRLVYTKVMTELADTFDSAFSKAVDLGNKIADKDKDADLWDIADGLLAGAIQYWLYSRQPCGDTRCQDCMPYENGLPIWVARGPRRPLVELWPQIKRFI